MGTEVLRAQDPLQRMRVIGHGTPVLSPERRNSCRSNYQNPNLRKPHHEHHQQHKKRENMVSKKSSYLVDDCVVSKKNSNSNLVMGGFTLLKRGESIDEATKKKIDECLVVESKKKVQFVDEKPKIFVETKKKIQFVDEKPKKKKTEKKNNDFVVLGGTKRIGPDPQMVPKQVNISDLMSTSPPSVSSSPPSLYFHGVFNRSGPIYAGAGFFQSPEPDSLPLPSFNIKKKGGFVVVDDTGSVSATEDLRRMLGIDGVFVDNNLEALSI